MRIDYSDKTVGGFTYEFVRGLSTQDSGAAEYGECMETARRIRRNDLDSWTREWTRTADRVAAYADRRRREGDVIAARGAYLRAANYYRMAVFYVIHTDPSPHRVVAAERGRLPSRGRTVGGPDRDRRDRLRRGRAAGLFRLRR